MSDLVTTLLGGGVEGSGVRTSNAVSWDWGVEESPGGVDDLTSKHSKFPKFEPKKLALKQNLFCKRSTQSVLEI